MVTSITDADIKASGEITTGPFSSRSHGSQSESSLENEIKKGHQTPDFDKTYHAHDGEHISRYQGTFDTVGDSSFYTPIERYEGKHRYDPNFEWEPKEERRLIRKVKLVINSFSWKACSASY